MAERNERRRSGKRSVPKSTGTASPNSRSHERTNDDAASQHLTAKVPWGFSPENLPHNLNVVQLLKEWAQRKNATPAQLSLAWLLARKPWIVPIPGTTQMPHLLENSGADSVVLTSAEFAELTAQLSATKIQGARPPDAALQFSGVEAPEKA